MARTKAWVYAGDKRLGTFTIKAPRGWSDHTLPLPDILERGKPCSLVLDTHGPIALAPCELAHPQTNAQLVLVFLIDTLRQDHVGCYGYARNTTPNIDTFAQDGIRFTELVPQATWTRPSVASLFTSTYPSVHGAQDKTRRLQDGLPALATALRNANFETCAYVNNVNCVAYWGFGAGFDQYVGFASFRADAEDDSRAIDRATKVLGGLRRPRYLYVHTMAPHKPYTPPEPFKSAFERAHYEDSPEGRRQRTLDAYDAEIASADAAFGQLMEEVKRLGFYDQALIIVLSDHGQQFGEHGDTGHGKSLFEEELRVPLLIKLPHGAYSGEVRQGLVEMVDLAPTVLDVLGLPPEPRFQGRSFLPHIETAEPAKDTGFASLRLSNRHVRMARTLTHKYIHDLVSDDHTWYDLVQDPREIAPALRPAQTGEALTQHAALLAQWGAPGLHVMVTDQPNSNRMIDALISGPPLGEFNLLSRANHGRAERRGHAVHLAVPGWPVDSASTDEGSTPRTWPGVRNYAYLHVDTGTALKVDLDVLSDGQPILPECVQAGPQRTHLPLDGSPILIETIKASPELLTTALLPPKFAVYLWHVSGGEEIPEDQIDPEVREAMQALGYID